MSRELKTITTALGGNVIVIKAWLTESENRKVQDFWMSQATIETGKEIGTGELEEKDVKVKLDITNDPKAILKYYDLLMEVWVVSVNGEQENVLSLMQELRSEDFKEVIGIITNKKKDEEKKTKKTVKPTGLSS